MLSVWLKSIAQRYLDVRLRAGRDFDTRILERPGCWMPAAELDTLSAELREVASRTLPAGSLTYGVFSGDRTRLAHSIVTVVYRRSDRRPVAFNAMAAMALEVDGRPEEVLHLGLVMVDPDVRSQGLSWVLYGLSCFLLLVRKQMRPLWVSNVTQVPAIVGMVAETFSDVFPGPHPGARRRFVQLLAARQIMAGHRHVFGVGADAVFDEQRFVITNAYTGGSDALKKTFDEAQKHRKPAYNDFCARELDYARGDDVLQLGRMDLEAAVRYLRHSVPRAAWAQVLLSAGVLVVQRLALPVLHWFDSDREWGRLRPWNR
ncbi:MULTISPECIES: hypothetical protein [unclassified Lysobacter]|uniref:hypothetical protein n=1 Tax=unclassified Lysobacter TaxID=2635362 RepID=UPI001C23810D|nr:hypothetical protein [Lysobacter sp. MMG2]MBU8976434.1 hypothetical protein [Lysobacter sp. MMG2]